MEMEAAAEGIENCLLCFTKCDDWIFVNSEKGIKLNIRTILLKYFCLEVCVINKIILQLHCNEL